MKKLFLILFLCLGVFAQNPHVYSSLGDVIYNSVDGVVSLKGIKRFKNYTSAIDAYAANVYKAKDIGFLIDSGDKSIDKKSYLKTLRKLAKEHDFFVRMTLKSFKESMLVGDNALFVKTLSSNLFDTHGYKEKILNYYYNHESEITPHGILKKYVDEEERKRLAEQRRREARLTKKQIQEAKIRRLRKRAKERDEALQKELEMKLKLEKEKIRQEQLRELVR